MKAALCAATATLGLSVGHALAAEPVTITSSGVYAPATINVSGFGNEWSSAVDLTTLYGASQTPRTLYVFCVDLGHEILVNYPGNTDLVTAGGNNQYHQTLNYKTASLTNDSSGALSGTGAALSQAQVNEIADLAAEGGTLIDHDLGLQAKGEAFDGAALSDSLGAIQGAIWSIEYPSRTVSASDPTVASEMASYISSANPNFTGKANAIYAVNGANQGFVVAGVPESGTWVLMLAGFGAMGALVRRRRARSGLV